MRGAIASMAMTGMRVLSVSLGLVEQAPPQQLAGESTGARRAVVELGHWGVGALGGASFGALPREWRERPWTGPLYGLAIWSGFEATAKAVGLPHAEHAGILRARRDRRRSRPLRVRARRDPPGPAGLASRAGARVGAPPAAGTDRRRPRLRPGGPAQQVDSYCASVP